VLESINRYLPVVIINGLAAILFMIGFALLGVAMIKTATLPRWSGVLVAVGAPAHLLGLGWLSWSQPPGGRSRSWAVRVSASAWPGPDISSGTHRPSQMCLCQKGRPDYERWIFGEPCRQACWHSTPRAGDHLPGGRCPGWPFFVVAVVLMASAPWVLLQP